jgi:caa(3)-type oxidase subunit IV
MAAHADAAEARKHYVKIWGILVVLLVISVAGPFLGIRVVTLIAAFGIAIVKAFLVVKNFMHINLEKKYVTYIVVTMVVLMLLFVGGVSPDVLKHEGHHWENIAAKDAVKRGLAEVVVPKGEEGEEGGKGGVGEGEKKLEKQGGEKAPANGAPVEGTNKTQGSEAPGGAK